MPNSIASRIVELRALRKLTQEELAKLTGLKPSAISYFETGNRTPTLRNLLKLSSALQCTCDELIKGPINRREPFKYSMGREQEVEEAACLLHNSGAQLSGNTQAGDIDWFARWLYGSSNFGGGCVSTSQWSLSNEEFEQLGLLPDRAWTGKRWDLLTPEESEAWRKLARLCLYALPHIAERIGARFMAQAKALKIQHKLNHSGEAD